MEKTYNNNNMIELTSNAKDYLDTLETNKAVAVNIILHLLGFKKTVTMTNQQNIKNYQTFYTDKTKVIRNIFLQVIDETILKVGDIHLIKCLKAINTKNCVIFVVGPKGFEVIGFRNVPNEHQEFNTTKDNTLIHKPLNNNPQPNNLKYNPNIYLLSGLTTFSKDISVFVTITNKRPIKKYTSQATGQPGQLLSFTMKDVEGYQMDAVVFGAVADKFNQILTENKNYFITKGYVKLNDKRYSLSHSDYRLTFNEETVIEEVQGNVQYGEEQLHLISIEDLPKLPLHLLCDCIVYVIEVGETRTIQTKKGEEMQMRKVIIGDASGFKCELTLWKEKSNIEIEPKQILLMQCVKVGDFNGRNLSAIDDTKITINPLNDEAKSLHEAVANSVQWKTLEKSNLSDYSLPSEITSLQEVLTKAESQERGPIYKSKATIFYILHSSKNYYIGCPENTCKKKLINESNDYHCPNCNKQITNPAYYYILSLRVGDWSDQTYIDIYGETCSKLFQMQAKEYKDIIENNDTIKMKEISSRIEFKEKFFYGKARIHSYNNTERKRLTVYKIEDIDKAKEARITLNNLKFLGIK